MKGAHSFAIVIVIAAAFAAGGLIRSWLGVELDLHSIRSWVGGLGPMAPLLFVTIVGFRQFLLLPALLLLPAGGICFGASLGTVLGAAGILISGVVGFSLARGIAGDWLRRRLGRVARRVESPLWRAGPLLVGIATAHPAGPMTLLHWGAGLSGVRVMPFLMALAAGGLVRSFVYSFFGSTLLDFGSARFLLATGIFAAAVLVPLAHPGLRRQLLGIHGEGRVHVPPEI